jgi:hypothetical protein
MRKGPWWEEEDISEEQDEGKEAPYPSLIFFPLPLSCGHPDKTASED